MNTDELKAYIERVDAKFSEMKRKDDIRFANLRNDFSEVVKAVKTGDMSYFLGKGVKSEMHHSNLKTFVDNLGKE